MEFFDSLINEVHGLIAQKPSKSFEYNKNSWEDIGYSQVILLRDCAFELSGTGFNLVTSQPISDEIIVVGEELDKIKKSRGFARISILQIEDERDEQKAYSLIRKIEYVKYKFFPKGYMLRAASRSHKEAVRVSKEALKNKISFQKIGSLLIDKYKEIPAVKGVKVIFVTDENTDFYHLEQLAKKNNSITEALNHIMSSVNFDCDSCNLKPICDEVEGMKELHFKTAGNMG